MLTVERVANRWQLCAFWAARRPSAATTWTKAALTTLSLRRPKEPPPDLLLPTGQPPQAPASPGPPPFPSSSRLTGTFLYQMEPNSCFNEKCVFIIDGRTTRLNLSPRINNCLTNYNKSTSSRRPQPVNVLRSETIVNK